MVAESAAERAALMYTLIQTARLNDVDPCVSACKIDPLRGVIGVQN
jgi:hypothetical protein